jgi:N-acetylmuramoyl-L-alanine amidase
VITDATVKNHYWPSGINRPLQPRGTHPTEFLRSPGHAVLTSALALLLAFPLSGVPTAHADTGVEGASVFLDPGHNAINDASITRQVPNGRGGTKDCQTSGTSTNDGFPEHTFNWDVVLRIQGALNARGVRTELSRSSESGFGPCVDERAAEANAMHPDAIVSIHADGGPDWGRGFHVNYSAPPLNDVQGTTSVELAQIMRDTLHADGLLESDYIGSNGLFGRGDLAGLNLANYPAVLVELGNMRNPDDAGLMESEAGEAAYANAVVDGIVAFLKQRPPQS